MTWFKSRTQPLCRACGKPLRKWTTQVMLTLERTKYQNDTSYNRYVVVDKLPQTKAECQKLTNQTIVSVKRHKPYNEFGVQLDEGIDQFNEWDGETYDDEFFCTNSCAEGFGRMAARSGKIHSQAYADAIKDQRNESKTPS